MRDVVGVDPLSSYSPSIICHFPVMGPIAIAFILIFIIVIIIRVSVIPIII
jgi:hypothetical protein